MTPRDPAWIKRTARLAGSLYLAGTPFSIFGIMYVPSVLVVPGDAGATARNIMASEWLLRSGTVSHLVAELILLFLVLTLYQLLKPVNKSQAALMVALVLVSVPIGFGSEINRLAALRLLSGAAYLEPLGSVQIHAQAMLALDIWGTGILLTRAFWGLWLFPLGYLIIRSRFLPRLLGILVIIAGGGHVFDVVLAILLPSVELTISQFTFVGEVALLLWLLIKGVNVAQWQQVAGAQGTTVV